MVLNDIQVYYNVIGGIMKDPNLLIQYNDINSNDFGRGTIKVIFASIYNLFSQGVKEINVMVVDSYIRQNEAVADAYDKDQGLAFLQDCYDLSMVENFDYNYKKLKKLSLLRRLKKEHYNIDLYYKDNFDTLKEESETIDRFEEATIEDILLSVESKYNKIRADFITSTNSLHSGDAVAGLEELVEYYKKTPDVGPELAGDLYNSVCRGARQGTFLLRSAASGTGKTRLAVYDAAKIAYPRHWSCAADSFVKEMVDGEERKPLKTLFITTEMRKDEIQTILLSYISGVDEEHIISGRYDMNEPQRIRHALQIMKDYKEYFYIDHIPDPNLNNVEAVIKKYISIEKVKYIFHDYIFSSPSLLAQFQNAKLREDSALALMGNTLKQLATDYNVFISSSTQVNASGMEELVFHDEGSIRGSRALADKVDGGCVMRRPSPAELSSVESIIRSFGIQPTHYFDVYKMRRGKYKGIRIWSRINLGNGSRQDLFVTDEENNLVNIDIIYKTSTEVAYETSNYDF